MSNAFHQVIVMASKKSDSTKEEPDDSLPKMQETFLHAMSDVYREFGFAGLYRGCGGQLYYTVLKVRILYVMFHASQTTKSHTALPISMA
jgi:hypothetical protein